MLTCFVVWVVVVVVGQLDSFSEDAFAIKHHSGPNSAPSAVPQFDASSAWVQCATNTSSDQPDDSAPRSNRIQDHPCIAQVRCLSAAVIAALGTRLASAVGWNYISTSHSTSHSIFCC